MLKKYLLVINNNNMKQILTEDKIKSLVLEELKKSDVIEIAKKDKDFEKRIKEIVKDVVTDLFRVLYQHNGIFNSLGK